jgi:hypothetical protein
MAFAALPHHTQWREKEEREMNNFHSKGNLVGHFFWEVWGGKCLTLSESNLVLGTFQRGHDPPNVMPTFKDKKVTYTLPLPNTLTLKPDLYSCCDSTVLHTALFMTAYLKHRQEPSSERGMCYTYRIHIQNFRLCNFLSTILSLNF